MKLKLRVLIEETVVKPILVFTNFRNKMTGNTTQLLSSDTLFYLNIRCSLEKANRFAIMLCSKFIAKN